MAGRGSLLSFNSYLLLSWGANYGPLTFDHQFWRIFTCMFVHGGVIHVGANMWCFWDFGRIAERVYGRWRFAVIYLLTGLASSIASLAIHPTTVSVGASGAIFGAVGALVFPFYRKRVILPSPVMKAMMRSLVTFIVINLLIGSAVPFIDNAAHVGGLLAGLALGAVITQLAMSGHDLNRVFPKVAATTAVLVGFAFAGIQHLHSDTVLPAQALIALDRGDTQEALQRAQRAVVKNPKSALANYALGSALLELHRYQEALRPLQQAVKLDPQNVEFMKTLAEASARAASQSVQSK
jgi:rhomboid protease GluP